MARLASSFIVKVFIYSIGLTLEDIRTYEKLANEETNQLVLGNNTTQQVEGAAAP